MKAATGELNLTIVTVIAISALLFFFGTVFWPQIKTALTNAFSNQQTEIEQETEIVPGQ